MKRPKSKYTGLAKRYYPFWDRDSAALIWSAAIGGLSPGVLVSQRK